MTVNIIATDDWNLIVNICHWSYTTDLPEEVKKEAYKAAWHYTDAYGEMGYIPPQGYDWSGFRDSSKESNAKSANAIRVVLAYRGITEFQAEKR